MEPLGKVRILQLWVTLPSASRWVAPRFEHVPRKDAPLRQEPGIRLSPNAIFEQAVPSSYNGFLYRSRATCWLTERLLSDCRLAKLDGWNSAFHQQLFADLVRLSQGYAQGHMPQVSELPGA